MLNLIDLFFEGIWSWVQVNYEEYKKLKSDNTISNNNLKCVKKGQYKKYWLYTLKLQSLDYSI